MYIYRQLDIKKYLKKYTSADSKTTLFVHSCFKNISRFLISPIDYMKSLLEIKSELNSA